MAHRTVLSAVLVLFLLLLCGCKSDRVAREVAELRKANKLEEARNLAVSSLQEKGGGLILWRELAATDVAMAEEQASARNPEPYERLIEAALLCTAMSEYQAGKLDERWSAVAARVASKTLTVANRAVNSVNVRTARGHTRLGAKPLSDMELESERYVEPDDMEWAVRYAVPLLFFARHLQALQPDGFDASIESVEQRIAQMGVSTNLTSHMVDASCRKATAASEQSLAAALEDLKDAGRFHAATIFETRTPE